MLRSAQSIRPRRGSARASRAYGASAYCCRAHSTTHTAHTSYVHMHSLSRTLTLRTGRHTRTYNYHSESQSTSQTQTLRQINRSRKGRSHTLVTQQHSTYTAASISSSPHMRTRCACGGFGTKGNSWPGPGFYCRLIEDFAQNRGFGCSCVKFLRVRTKWGCKMAPTN